MSYVFKSLEEALEAAFTGKFMEASIKISMLRLQLNQNSSNEEIIEQIKMINNLLDKDPVIQRGRAAEKFINKVKPNIFPQQSQNQN